MKNVLLIKEVYTDTFKGLDGRMVKSNFKALSMFCLAAYFIVLYAYEYGNATGIVYA